MKTMPEIGTRVRYQCTSTYCNMSLLRESPCTGVVTKQYPGYVECIDGESVECPDFVAMKVDELPDWWCYTDTNVFAPEVSELEVV